MTKTNRFILLLGLAVVLLISGIPVSAASSEMALYGKYANTQYHPTCANCKGVGKTYPTCSSCSGSGVRYYGCSTCGGDGHTSYITQDPCYTCNGAGGDCFHCGGTGKLPTSHQVTCGSCGGSGGSLTKNCPSCKGSGQSSTARTCSPCSGSGLSSSWADKKGSFLQNVILDHESVSTTAKNSDGYWYTLIRLIDPPHLVCPNHSEEDLGQLAVAPVIIVIPTADTEAASITVEAFVDDLLVWSADAESEEEVDIEMEKSAWKALADGEHILTVTVTDNYGQSAHRIFEFFKLSHITVSVPYQMEFAYDPNKEELIAPDGFIKNEGDFPISLSFFNVQPDEKTAVNIALPDRFADWSMLRETDTTENIALGIESDGKTQWLGVEEKTPMLVVPAKGQTKINLTAKLGNSWPSKQTLGFSVFFRITVA